MKTLTTCFYFFFSLSLLAQEKGVSPISTDGTTSTGSTYAVVVGISDYQEEGIPDLRFADKDAEAFANFLLSPAGGSLDEDHLKLLTNQNATAGMVGEALFWLIDECKDGDKAIIYFSGHGDVERKLRTQPGYLLCWDAPSTVYMAGGVVDIRMLQDVISTLSIDNQTKVIIVTDACRAGKLAGNEVNGSQLTSTNLSTQFANEIKILSCQPDEYSIEGEQWGGGRGAFSFHLVEGLYGLADRDQDQSINLMEMRSYLEQQVSAEVAPHSQFPMTVGSPKQKLVDVFPDLLEQVKARKAGQTIQFSTADSRGIEEEVLAAAGETVSNDYKTYKSLLKEKTFFKPREGRPTNEYADAYFEKLIAEPALERLHAAMRRSFAAVLQDDAQQVINRFLKSDPSEIERSKLLKKRKYAIYPLQLQRAANLLGPDHYMYPILKARQYYFEGYLYVLDLMWHEPKKGKEGIKILQKALEFQPGMPTALNQISIVYGQNLNQLDSAEHYAKLALMANPKWLNVYVMLAQSFRFNNQYEKAKEWLDIGYAVDSNSVSLLLQIGIWHMELSQHDEALKVFDRAIAIDSLAAPLFFKGRTLTWAKRYSEAEKLFHKVYELDSLFLADGSGLGQLYIEITQYDKAIEVIQKDITIDETNSRHYSDMGLAYLRKGELEKAKSFFNKAVLLDSNKLMTHQKIGYNYYIGEYWQQTLETTKKMASFYPADHPWGPSTFGDLYLKMDQLEKALTFTEQALSIDPKDEIANISMGVLHLRKKEYKKAGQALRKALEVPGNRKPRIHYLLGLAHHLSGQKELAEKDWKQGLENPEKIWITGLNFRKTDFVSQWENCLHELQKLDPSIPEIYFELSRLYANEGRLNDAFENLELAIQKGYSDYYGLQWEVNMTPLRAEAGRWKELMDEYFPNMF